MTDEVQRIHYLSKPYVEATLTHADGLNLVAATVAWLGRAEVPPVDADLVSVEWVGDPAPTRTFRFLVDPDDPAKPVPDGVYRVWYKPTSPPEARLEKVTGRVVIYGR